MAEMIISLIAWSIALVFVLLTLSGIFFVVRQQNVAIIERFGRFVRVAHPGLSVKWPIIERIVHRADLRVIESALKAETKTKDNVFVTIHVVVQYSVLPDKVYDAFYKLSQPAAQIQSFVFDVVRARVPKLELDNVFEHKDDIAKAVQEELAASMLMFGYGIMTALITEIDPAANVKSAMNEINTAQRLRVAAAEKGEAERILAVKKAEAEAQSKELQGKGIAAQRKAIIDGLRESVKELGDTVQLPAADAMQMVLLTQYFDTIKEIGANGKNTTILLPHSPAGVSDLGAQLRDAMIVAERVQ